MQRLSMQSGAMMNGDDDSDSDYDDQMEHNRTNGNRNGPPDMLFGVVHMPPQQRKVFMVVCVVMALATAFNVATVGYSFQDNRKTDGGRGGNYNSLSEHAQASATNGGMLRATSFEGEANNVAEGEAPIYSSGNAEGMGTHFQYSSEVPSQEINSNSISLGGDTNAYQQYASAPTGDAQSQLGISPDGTADGGAPQTDQFGQVLLSQTELMKEMQEQMKQQQEMFLKMQEMQQQPQVIQQQMPIEQQPLPTASYEAPASTVPVPESTAPEVAAAPLAIEGAAPPVETPAPVEATGPPPIVEGPNVDGFRDAWDLPVNPATDTPVFWHIPKAGGSTVKDIMGTCHRFTMASEAGVAEGHDQDTEIAIVHIGGDAATGQDPSPFVNVDTTTPAGLQRAKELGLAQSRLADSIVTPYIFDANGLFDDTYKGRLFTVFRHPVDRAISLFNYLQIADWEPTYSPELANMSLEEYARSDVVENNWMTRYLSNQISGDLTEKNVEIAMDIVRRKFLVGLLTKKEETMERLEKYFGWKYSINPTNQEICRESLLGTGANANANKPVKKEKPKPGDPEYDALAHQNNFDIMLYEYIETLFVEQGQFVEAIPDGYRLEGATCCKCGVPTC